MHIPYKACFHNIEHPVDPGDPPAFALELLLRHVPSMRPSFFSGRPALPGSLPRPAGEGSERGESRKCVRASDNHNNHIDHTDGRIDHTDVTRDDHIAARERLAFSPRLY
jgi:hypothetical protein